MKIEWNRITWRSALLILIFFIAVLALGFYAGTFYETLKIQNEIRSSAGNAAQITSADFTCDSGKSIHAVFFDGKATVMLSDGRTMNLLQTISADGGRYANTDESFVFWTKSQGAFVQENGTTTFSDCVAKQN